MSECDDVDVALDQLRAAIDEKRDDDVRDVLEELAETYDLDEYSSAGLDWESVGRGAIADQIRDFRRDEVDPHFHNITRGIENGADPSEDFWKLIQRQNEFAGWIKQDLIKTGDFDRDGERVSVFSTTSHVQAAFLNLERSGSDRHLEQARDALRDAEELLATLEAKQTEEEG